MARVLYDGLVEYDDGTPATTSQMAKDVVSFLHWAAEPEMDDRKKMGFQAVCILSILFGVSIWIKRFKVRHLHYSGVGILLTKSSGPRSKQESWCTILQRPGIELDARKSVSHKILIES